MIEHVPQAGDAEERAWVKPDYQVVETALEVTLYYSVDV